MTQHPMRTLNLRVITISLPWLSSWRTLVVRLEVAVILYQKRKRDLVKTAVMKLGTMLTSVIVIDCAHFIKIVVTITGQGKLKSYL